jgi:hypothetical protein
MKRPEKILPSIHHYFKFRHSVFLAEGPDKGRWFDIQKADQQTTAPNLNH